MESNDRSQARKRKIPDRFGNAGDISSAESEPFGDDSFEDRNYEPQAKKSTVHEHNKNAVASKNFDNIFDEINVDKRTVNDILLEASVEKECSVEIEPEKEDNSSRQDINNNENSQTELLRQLILKLHEKTDDILARLTVLETTAIENEINCDKHRKSTGKTNCTNSEIGKIDSFLKSINLPISQKDSLDKLERDLFDVRFRTVLVCIFTKKKFRTY